MLTRVVCLLLMCALLGCGSKPRAPVEDRSVGGSGGGSVYYVQRGDTLYSIAFRYGLDFRKMAAANRIAYPYTIYPGQKLSLREAAVPASRAQAPVKAPARPASKSATSSAPPPKTVVSATTAPPVRTAPDKTATNKTVTAWRWPTTGRVIRSYSSSVHKGIDIGGERGDPILAVADGTVVYAGTGIVGMGELVIVKHNDIYLSAYAHNDRLLVREGERVRVGQKIASKGSSGTDAVKLHFEIRKEGKPVNPVRLLPRR